MALLLKFCLFFKISVSGECRKLHSEDELGLYFAPNIIRVIQSSVLKCAGYKARVEDRKGGYRVLVGKMRERERERERER